MNLDIINKQIKDNFYKAFFDKIKETVKSDKPDYEWISSLYIEIKNRLLSLTKKDGKTFTEIDESFDSELFDQMIINDVFDVNSMIKLINNTYSWIEKLQSPMRDKELQESKNNLFREESDNIIPKFLMEVHKYIDYIYEDLDNLKSKKK
jgi:hypothetical protein